MKKKCRIEFHPIFVSGAGGGEASVFAQQVFEMYLRFADSLGFGVSAVETEVPAGANIGIKVFKSFE